MRRKKLFDRIRHNYLLIMIVCCAIPIILLVVLIYVFGFSKSYLYWLVLLLCPIMHYFLMKDMHKKYSDKNREVSGERNESENKGKGEDEKCH